MTGAPDIGDGFLTPPGASHPKAAETAKEGLVIYDDKNPDFIAPVFIDTGLSALKAKSRRSRSGANKIAVSIRLDPDIVSAWKATGPGWQTRMNETLRHAMPRPS